MKIKFVVDQLPYPPRNGVTIPTWGYLRLLAERHRVHLVVLSDDCDRDRLIPEPLMNICASISIVERKRRGLIAAALDEILLRRARFANWSYGETIVVKGNPTEPQVVLASPISCVDYVDRTEARDVPFIAAISDVYLSVISDSSMAHFDEGRFLRGWLGQLRYGLLRRLEGKALRRASLILVQTERDREWSKRLLPADLWRQVVVVANGVGDEHRLPSRTLPAPEPRLLFITSRFIPHYAQTVRWILENVWNTVRGRVPNARFLLVGRGLTDHDDLSRALAADRSLEYVPYAEDLTTIYGRTRVAVAKINKSYGFINKVAEALAQGIPVVGDNSAFNGLEAAIDAGAGFVANNADDMASRIIELLSDDQSWIVAARAAQERIGPNLRWEARRELLEDALVSSLKGPQR